MTNEIEKIFNGVKKEIDTRLMGEWIGTAQNEIKKRTPVITGRLKGSIDTDGGFDGKTIEIGADAVPSHFVESGTEYAAYVEFGTSRQKAQGMFKRGLDATDEIIEEDVANLIEEGFDNQFSKFLKRIFK